MWSRPLSMLGFFALTILASQSHEIHKRGLLSKLFGGGSKLNQDVEGDLPPRERSKYRELLKNPIVITMLSAAVGMIVQQALQTRNMNDVCENKYVKMAHTASGFSPELQRLVNLLGCHGPNRKYGSSTMPSSGKFSTTPGYSDDDNDEQPDTNNDQDPAADDGEALESGFTPEKESRFKQIASIARGEKGAKRNFLKGLFGMKSKDKGFKPGQKLPSSSYELDKDDANALKDLDKELEQYNKAIH